LNNASSDRWAVNTGTWNLKFSGPVGNPPVIGVVSETFAQTGKVFFFAFNLPKVKAAVCGARGARRTTTYAS
jgi:hypothetical protein